MPLLSGAGLDLYPLAAKGSSREEVPLRWATGRLSGSGELLLAFGHCAQLPGSARCAMTEAEKAPPQKKRKTEASDTELRT